MLLYQRREHRTDQSRNETADATHLAEFHQVEGVVADYDITLGNLIGTFLASRFNCLGVLCCARLPCHCLAYQACQNTSWSLNGPFGSQLEITSRRQDMPVEMEVEKAKCRR